MTDLEALAGDVRRRVEEQLDAVLPTDAQAGDLARAMRHAALSGGKRMRPVLACVGALDVGGEVDDAIGAAVGVELVHAYSLVHDDLPCMDDSALRRGLPSVHAAFGEAMGVLAGDALLTLAFEQIVALTRADRPVAAMCVTLARAAGWEGMVGGQVADLEGEGQRPDLERVREIHRRKTAALIGAALELGGLAGGGAGAEIERLREVGVGFGLAFQIVDDLLDLESTTEVLGKPAGADVDHEKMTWPAVVGVETARADARALVDEALERAKEGHALAIMGELGARILGRVL